MKPDDPRYDIQTRDILFPAGHAIDTASIAAAQTPWWNRTLCAVNDAWIRLAVMEGEFHWHKHDAEDEFFLVLDGHLDIELEDRVISLDPRGAVTIPKGVVHRPRARGKTTVLLVEKAGVAPTGD